MRKMKKWAAYALLFAIAPLAFAGPTPMGGSKFSGGTITSPILAADGSAANPAYSYSAAPTEGMFRLSATNLGFAFSGSAYAYLGTAGLALVNDNETIQMGGSSDIVLARDAANTLAQRNGANAQTFRIYNTYTDASNYERMEIGANPGGLAANTFGIFDTGAGTGTTSRTMYLGMSGNGVLKFRLNNVDQLNWQAGSVYPATGANTFTIGTAGNEFKSAYFKTSIEGAATKTLTETSATSFVTITVPNSGACSGIVVYTVFAADATNTQAKSGELHFSAVANSTGTVTAAAVSDVNNLNPVSSGTLTNTMTSTTAANATTLLANATSSLTQTTLEIRYRVQMSSGTCTVTGL